MAKLIICLVLAALAGCAVAQLVPIPGSRDLSGGYYDHYTGQYSSAITGRVYNTAPVVAAAPALLAPRPALLASQPIIAAAPALIPQPALAPAFGWVRK